MRNQPFKALVFLTQGLGVVFFVIFLLAFYLPMPSNDTLVGDAAFQTPMAIFGLLFVALAIVSLAASLAARRRTGAIETSQPPP